MSSEMLIENNGNGDIIIIGHQAEYMYIECNEIRDFNFFESLSVFNVKNKVQI